MTAFTITPVGKGIMRCRHIDALYARRGVKSLAKFLEDYKGKLLIDLTGTTAEECLRNIKNFRPMMPTAAIFWGANWSGRSWNVLRVTTRKRCDFLIGEAEGVSLASRTMTKKSLS